MRIELPLRPARALLGGHFSAFAGSFALANMYPELKLWHYVCLLMVMRLPNSLGCAFRKLSGSAPISTAMELGAEP
jgi:hypothetical protein